MALMFQVTPSLKRAVTLINKLDVSKFPLLLSRIIQKLHLRDERAFSVEEEEKLQGAFELDADDLHIVLEMSAFILEQAAYHNAKPQVFQQQLQNIQLVEDKIQVFLNLWSAQAKSVVEKLKQRSWTPKQLQDVNWRLNLQMAQATQAKMKLPNAVMEFSLSGQNKEKVNVEFTHDELFAFYNQLETIQGQLDALR